MKAIRIIPTIIVFLSMAFISACSEEKTVSLEGHEDIVTVIQKLPECYDNPNIAMEIYTDDAILMRMDPRTGQMVKLTGPKEIGDYKKEIGKGEVVMKLSINSIKRETDKAHVEYTFHRKTIEGRDYVIPLNCTAEMVKREQTWKIKEDRVEY
jgi:hypothetical protein